MTKYVCQFFEFLQLDNHNLMLKGENNIKRDLLFFNVLFQPITFAQVYYSSFKTF